MKEAAYFGRLHELRKRWQCIGKMRIQGNHLREGGYGLGGADGDLERYGVTIRVKTLFGGKIARQGLDVIFEPQSVEEIGQVDEFVRNKLVGQGGWGSRDLNFNPLFYNLLLNNRRGAEGFLKLAFKERCEWQCDQGQDHACQRDLATAAGPGCLGRAVVAWFRGSGDFESFIEVHKVTLKKGLQS